RPRRLHIPKPCLHQLVMRVINPLLLLLFHTPPLSSTTHPPRKPSLLAILITHLPSTRNTSSKINLHSQPKKPPLNSKNLPSPSSISSSIHYYRQKSYSIPIQRLSSF
ncbi:MAG: hypothetical protein N2035_10225, partial [Chthoniobacterales bacterium]|nr:hypothetical protein [Chthoniobacterales bacterium]